MIHLMAKQYQIIVYKKYQGVKYVQNFETKRVKTLLVLQKKDSIKFDKKNQRERRKI